MNIRNRQRRMVPGLLAAVLLAAGLAAADPQTDKLAVIANLLRQGDSAASQTLRGMAQTDPDLFVRERALLALAQIGGADSIPALVEIGTAPPSPAVRRAAFDAVYTLRQRFPLPDPPQVTFKAVSPLATGKAMTFEATVVSPVDRPHVRIQLAGSRALRPVGEAGSPLPGYQGPLKAGQAVKVRASYQADQDARAELRATVRVSLNAVDATTYTSPLYLDLKEGSGTASPTPPQGTGKAVHRAAQTGIARFLVSGTLRFEDGDQRSDLGLDNLFTRPARLVNIAVMNANGVVFGSGETASDGSFLIAANVPAAERVGLFAEVRNSVLELYQNTDGVNDPFREPLFTFTQGQASDIALGTITKGVNYQTVRIEEPLNSYDAVLSFSAALNINEVILQARDMADDNRDPRETDTIGQVTVEYCDSSTPYYLFSVVLSCARVDGLQNTGDGRDDGYVDTTIAHEYAHRLQFDIGAWDGHWETHRNCEETDTAFNDDAEIAWSEGFADFFGEVVAVYGDRMSRRRPTLSLDDTPQVERGCQPLTFVSHDDERFIAVEGNLIAPLWDLVDGLGSGDDAWDRVDGEVGNRRGFRSIFQIFDREIGTWDAPDLADFYDAWIGRHGNDPELGQPAFDPILNRYAIVPGGESTRGLEKMAPQPFTEAAPALPEGYSSLYTASNFLMPLKVTRRLSFAEPSGLAAQFTLRAGVSNLGVISLESYNLPGVPMQARAATYTTSIRFLRGSNWLAVNPAGATIASGLLTPVTFTFLPGALALTPGDRYEAIVDFVFRITRVDGQILTATRSVDVVFDFVDGPESDRDNDGLRTSEENSLRSQPGFECLSPTLRDSDGDSLSDGDEINIFHTSPCRRDTDGDSWSDWAETRQPCFRPLVPDSWAAPTGDPDGDGVINSLEQIRGSDVCRADTDNDGLRDGQDNCPKLATPSPLPDFDGDGMGDPCDPDADNDYCEKQYDANDTDPASLCALGGRDRLSPRRFMVEEDGRLQFLDAYLENLGQPQIRNCGAIACPPPLAQWTDPRFENLSVVRGADLGLSAADGFAWTSATLPDLDGRGRRDYAISAPWADGGVGGIDSGVVVLVSGEDNKEIGRLRGGIAGGAFGSSLALLADGRLAVGAPGAAGKAGTVLVYRLDNLTVVRTFTSGKAGDRFGAAVADLGDLDADGFSDLAVGAPGWNNQGAVYTARGTGALAQIALGKATGDRLGERLATVPDSDGDGKPELLAGAPGALRSGLDAAGEVALLGLDGARRWARAGRQSGESLGAALAVSRNGKELLVGAPGANCAAGARCGRGNLMRPDGTTVGYINGAEAGTELGRHVAFGPDLDGDGLPSLVLIETIPASAAGLGRSQFFER